LNIVSHDDLSTYTKNIGKIVRDQRDNTCYYVHMIEYKGWETVTSNNHHTFLSYHIDKFMADNVKLYLRIYPEIKIVDSDNKDNADDPESKSSEQIQLICKFNDKSWNYTSLPCVCDIPGHYTLNIKYGDGTRVACLFDMKTFSIINSDDPISSVGTLIDIKRIENASSAPIEEFMKSIDQDTVTKYRKLCFDIVMGNEPDAITIYDDNGVLCKWLNMIDGVLGSRKKRVGCSGKSPDTVRCIGYGNDTKDIKCVFAVTQGYANSKLPVIHRNPGSTAGINDNTFNHMSNYINFLKWISEFAIEV
jgi:hypothetical protein